MLWKRKQKLFAQGFVGWLLISSVFGQIYEMANCSTVDQCREVIVSLLELVRLEKQIAQSLEQENALLISEREKVKAEVLALAHDVTASNERVLQEFGLLKQDIDRRYDALNAVIVHKGSFWFNVVKVSAIVIPALIMLNKGL